jgi:plastocyanin
MTGALYKAALGFIILAGLLAAGSCGSGTPAATTTALTTAPTATIAPGAAAAVAIDNYVYIPAALTVSVGTAVTWTNKDSVAHTVTTRTALFDSGLFGKDKSFSYTFSQKGEYEYYCIPHPYMVGKVIVE